MSDQFLASLDEDKRSHFERHSDLDELLATIWNDAQQSWPGVQIDRGVFARYLAERVIGEAHEDAELPAHPTDLYLAVACILGDSKALTFFEDNILSQTKSVLSRLGLSTSDADDIRQDLRARLLVNTESREAVLSAYFGTGRLVQWVRAVAGREALASLKRRRKMVPFDDELFGALCDPQLVSLKRKYRVEFKQALHQAITHLDERERTIMKALVIDGDTVTEIARAHSVHRVTASKWVSKIRKTLFRRTRWHLREKLDLDESELESVIRLIESQMEMSLDRVLDSQQQDDHPNKP